MAATPIQPVNTAQNLNALLQLIQGGTTLVKGSSSTTTSKSNISDAGVSELLKQMLSGTQGLGAVAGAQKSAGLYNSSTNTMLTNDLLSRAAAETEVKRAGTTTTTKQNPQIGGSDILKLVALAAAKKYGGGVMDKVGEGVKDAGKSVLDFLSGDGLSVSTGADIGTSGVATNAAGGIVGAGSASLDALVSSLAETFGTSAGADAASSAGSSDAVNKLMESIGSFSAAPEATSSASGALSSGYNFSGEGSNSFTALSADSGSFSAGSGSGSGGGFDGNWGGYLSAFMQGLNNEKTGNRDYRQAVGTAIASYFGVPSAVTALAAPTLNKFSNSVMDNGYDQNGVAGAFFNEPIGTLVSGQYDLGDTIQGLADPANLFGGNPGGSIGGTLMMPIDFVGNQVEAIGKAIGWIICTELYRQGRLPRRFYVHGAKEFAKYPKSRIKGYYVWAIPCVRYLRNNPKSFFSSCLERVFGARAEYLAAVAGEKSARKTVAGFLTTHLLYAFCWTLSFFVPEQNWRTVYG